MANDVAIIGAGIIGMTVGVKLLENNFKVAIFTKDEPLRTNSDSAVATWYAPDDAHLTLQKLCLDSLPYFDELSKIAEAGIQRIPMIYFFKSEEDFRQSRWARESWKKLLNISDELPDNLRRNDIYRKAVSASIPLIDMNIYRPYLLDKFKRLGGKLHIKKIVSLLDVVHGIDILINCSGWEARYLTNDSEVYPIRGQIEITAANESLQQQYSFNVESLEAYGIFRPQSNDWAFGTTFQRNDAEKGVRKSDKEEILGKIAPFFPKINLLETSSKVGIRCGRSNIRIADEIIHNEEDKQILLVHCYGHGGSGVSASWGSAFKVLEKCLNWNPFNFIQQQV